MTYLKYLNELIDVAFEVKVRTKVKIYILTFWGLGSGLIESQSSNLGEVLSYAWFRCNMSKSRILRKVKVRSEKVTIGKVSRVAVDTCFILANFNV